MKAAPRIRLLADKFRNPSHTRGRVADIEYFAAAQSIGHPAIHRKSRDSHSPMVRLNHGATQRVHHSRSAALDIAESAHRTVHKHNSVLWKGQAVKRRADFRRWRHALSMPITPVGTTLE